MRTASVAALSTLIVASVVAYATAPSGEAIAAKAFTRPAPAGREAIKGRVLRDGKPARGTTVRILRRTRHGLRSYATVRVGAKGRFAVSVYPGPYVVVIKRPDAVKRLRVRVKRGHSIFIAATVERRGGHLVIAPVIFNY